LKLIFEFARVDAQQMRAQKPYVQLKEIKMITNQTKKWQLSLLVAVVLIGLLASWAYAAPAAAEKQWLVKGKFQANETFELDFVNMTMSVDAQGSGNAAHLGRYTYEYQATVNLLNGQGLGSAELVAANGDRLFAELHGQGTPIEPPDLHRVVETYTITGGTGRFANASGSLALERTVNTATGATSGTVNGTIVIP
jgi:hypothetical protein